MRILLAFLIPMAGWAADFTGAANFRIQTTPRSAVISYVAPSGAGVCTWEVSESSSYSPLVHDVDTILFANSNRDDRAGSLPRGMDRTFVLGQGGTGIDYAPIGADGVRYSRALQAATQHFGRVTCGSDTATVSFRTANLAGNPASEDIPFDPAGPAGEPAWPYLDPSSRTATVVDPQTGVLLKRLTYPRMSTAGDLGQIKPMDRVYNHAGTWTNPNNAKNTSGSGATYSGTAKDVLFLAYDNAGFNSYSLDLINALPTCSVSGTPTGDDGKAEIAITRDQVNPYGKWLPVTCGSSLSTEQKIGDDPSHALPEHVHSYFPSWLNAGQFPPRVQDMRAKSGWVDTSGTAVNLHVINGQGDAFYNIGAGSTITINAVDYIVASRADDYHLTLATSAGTQTTVAYSYSGFGLLVRKKTASTNTIEFRSRIGLGYSEINDFNNGGGSSAQCSNKLRPDPTMKLGYHCATIVSGSEWALWWIHPASGDVHFLGTIWTGSGPSWGNTPLTQSSFPFDTTTDANYDYMYGIVQDSSTGKPKLLRGKLQMDNSDVGNWVGGTAPNIAWSVLVGDLQSAIHGFESRYNISAFPLWDMVGIQDGRIVVKSGSQDHRAWIALIDQTSGSVTGAIDAWTRPGCSWCGIHTAFAQQGATFLKLNGKESRADNGGPFTLTTTSAVPAANGTGPDGAGSPFANCATLAPGNVLGLIGNRCNTVSFTSNTPAGPGGITVQALAVGDMIETGSEYWRLVKNTTGTTWIVQRAYSKDDCIGGNGCAAGAVPAGATVAMQCNGFPTELWGYGGHFSQDFWWDYHNDPHGDNAADPYGQDLPTATIFRERAMSNESHYDFKGDYTVTDGGCDMLGLATCTPLSPYNELYGVRHAAWPGHPRAITGFYNVAANVPFSGKYGIGYGNYLERHNSIILCDGDTVNSCPNFFVDHRPINLDYAISETVTPVSGKTNIFKVTGLEPDPAVDIKRQRLGVQLGRHVARNVSGPSSSIADGSAGNYDLCHAYAANECLPGSSPGEIYVNVPLPSGWPVGQSVATPGVQRCQNKDIAYLAENYVCVFIMPSDGDFVAQYALTGVTDYYGSGNRRITRGLIPPAGSDKLANARALPDGSWMVLWNPFVQNRPEVLLAKLPPWPAGINTLNRTDFIPIALATGLVPPGTDNAFVRFGYNPSFHCTRRQEACVANGGVLQTGNGVLSFEGTDSYNGLACVSGCMVTIPALSQRVMWYQWVFRNGSNGIIGTAPIEVLATP